MWTTISSQLTISSDLTRIYKSFHSSHFNHSPTVCHSFSSPTIFWCVCVTQHSFLDKERNEDCQLLFLKIMIFNMSKLSTVTLIFVVGLSYVVCQETTATVFSPGERDPSDTTTRRSRFLYEFNKEFDPPAYTWVPPGLTFTCKDRSPGYYADPQAKCQAYHLCMPDGRRYTMLCGIGTVFNQRTFVCDHWYNYQCANVESDYHINNDLWENVLLPHSGFRSPRSQKNRLRDDDEDDNNAHEDEK